jgi:hypothetical protein
LVSADLAIGDVVQCQIGGTSHQGRLTDLPFL